MKPVCLVIGAGAGIGGTVARRFAQEGYQLLQENASYLSRPLPLTDTDSH